MTISVGQHLPEVKFQAITALGIENVSASEVFKGKKVVVFGVPGAFTPVHHPKHLPDYLAHADALKASGVDRIVLTSTNDPFVLDAWAEATGASGAIDFLGDANAHFAKAIGLSMDATDRGMGIRSKRYSMVVDDGVVTRLAVEDSPVKVGASSAGAILDEMRTRQPARLAA